MGMIVGLCIAFILVAPLVAQTYVQRLPVAPACPCCRATTTELQIRSDPFRLLPLAATTTVGECGRCGWRGRMRWKWAPRAIRRARR